MGYPRYDAGILQSWVADLGLRHQVVLMSAVRGADGMERDDPAKWLNRFYRGVILRAHCGDPAKAQSFMVVPKDGDDFWVQANKVVRSFDHYPAHYILHLIHACEIVGYKHPDALTRSWFRDFYYIMCDKLHMNPETEAQLDKRLNADEDSFGASQRHEGSGAALGGS